MDRIKIDALMDDLETEVDELLKELGIVTHYNYDIYSHQKIIKEVLIELSQELMELHNYEEIEEEGVLPC